MKKTLKPISILLSIFLLISCFGFFANALKSPEYWDEDNSLYVNYVDNYSLESFYIDIKAEYFDNLDEIEKDILSCEYVAELEEWNHRITFEGIEDLNQDLSLDDGIILPSYFVKLKNINDYDAATQFFADKYYAERVWNDPWDGPALSGYYGDVTQDGEITASDARQILRYAVELDTIKTNFDKIFSDVNSDGIVNSADARLALRTSVKLEEKREIIL